MEIFLKQNFDMIIQVKTATTRAGQNYPLQVHSSLSVCLWIYTDKNFIRRQKSQSGIQTKISEVSYFVCWWKAGVMFLFVMGR